MAASALAAPARSGTRATAPGSWGRWLLAIVVVAAAARVAIIVATPHFVPWGDAADYQRHAQSIAAGYGFPATQIATPGTPSAFRPPAYPFLLGAVYAVFGVHLLAGRLLGAALGVLTVALLALVGRAIWGARVGLVAAAIGAVFLPFVSLSATLLSESLLLPVELGFVLCLIACARRPGLRWALVAGALCAVAALTRAVSDLWLLPALAVLAAAGAGGRRWRGVVGLLAAFVVVVVPWTIRNAEVFHEFVPVSTEGGFTLAGQYNDVAARRDALQAVWRVPMQVPSVAARLAPLYHRPGGVDEAQLDGALRHQGLTYLVHHPRHLAAAVWLDSLRMFDLGLSHQFTTSISYRELDLPKALREPTTLSAQLIGLVALVAVAVWIVGRRRGRPPFRLGPWWLWAIPLLTLLLTVPMVGNPLKRVEFDPFLILLATPAICAAVDRARERL